MSGAGARSKTQYLLQRELKKARVFEIRKLVRKIRLLNSKRGNEKQLEKNKRKQGRLLEEMETIKDLDLGAIANALCSHVQSCDSQVQSCDSVSISKEAPNDVSKRAQLRLMNSKCMQSLLKKINGKESVCPAGGKGMLLYEASQPEARDDHTDDPVDNEEEEEEEVCELSDYESEREVSGRFCDCGDGEYQGEIEHEPSDYSDYSDSDDGSRGSECVYGDSDYSDGSRGGICEGDVVREKENVRGKSGSRRKERSNRQIITATLNMSARSRRSRAAIKRREEQERSEVDLSSVFIGSLSSSNQKEKTKRIPKKFKNRLGQRARRRLWEETYGGKAKHLQQRVRGKQIMQPVSTKHKPTRARPSLSQTTGETNDKGKGSYGRKQSKQDITAGGDDKPLHPSWEASRKRKEQQLLQQHSSQQGTRIVFSDSD